jgi:hypothetical protein
MLAALLLKVSILPARPVHAAAGFLNARNSLKRRQNLVRLESQF